MLDFLYAKEPLIRGLAHSFARPEMIYLNVILHMDEKTGPRLNIENFYPTGDGKLVVCTIPRPRDFTTENMRKFIERISIGDMLITVANQIEME